MGQQERAYGHKRFAGFVEHGSKLLHNGEYQDFSDPMVRSWFIDGTSFYEFLDFISASNSLLKEGEVKEWKENSEQGVISVGKVVYWDPPVSSFTILQNFHRQMKEEIHYKNLDLWAVKLYAVLNLLHPSLDGNGRTARNLYSLLKDGKLLSQSQSGKRNREGVEVIDHLIHEGILAVARNEGLIGEECDDPYNYLQRNYTADFWPFYYQSPTSLMKFLAAKRHLQGQGRYRDEWKGRVMELNEVYGLSPFARVVFDMEYARVKEEVFWHAINTVDSCAEWCMAKLDEGLAESEKIALEQERV